MICFENLIREFTNENLCVITGIWVNFLCLLFECLSKINPINESRIGHRDSIWGILKSNFRFLGFDFEHMRDDFGHLGVAFGSIGAGSWSLGVDFSASRCRLFLSLGVDFGFMGVDFESLG